MGQKHTHAKVGGGTETHDDHAATAGHKHDGMLPLPQAAADKAKKAAMSHPAVIAVSNGERVQLSERVIPFVRAGQWSWDDYGTVTITPEDCTALVQHFNDHVREDSLPILSEDHDSTRAVGWVEELLQPEDGVVKARVKFNPVGDSLLANDEYRYASAQLLRDYTDAETGTHYNVVAAGLDLAASGGDPAVHSLTNKPRIKHMGRIAASEAGDRMAVMALSDAPISGNNPVKAARILLDESMLMNPLGDNDGSVPPCAFQPQRDGYASSTTCPGFTRMIDDLDGDGVCRFAAMGCNGYRAIDSSSDRGYRFSEEQRMTKQGQTAGTDPAATGAVTPPVADDAAATAAASSDEVSPINAANFSETNAILMAERSQRIKAESELRDLRERMDARDAADKIKAVTMRLSEAKRAGKVTPGEYDTLTADSKNLVRLAEDEFYLQAIEARPVRIDLSERGSGNDNVAPTNDNSHLLAAANAYIADQAKAGNKVSFSEAARHVALTTAQGG